MFVFFHIFNNLLFFPFSPSFICKWTESKASTIKQTIAKLTEIRSAICKHNSALYSATAEAKPTAMNESVIAISRQVSCLQTKLALLLSMYSVHQPTLAFLHT